MSLQEPRYLRQSESREWSEATMIAAGAVIPARTRLQIRCKIVAISKGSQDIARIAAGGARISAGAANAAGQELLLEPCSRRMDSSAERCSSAAGATGALLERVRTAGAQSIMYLHRCLTGSLQERCMQEHCRNAAGTLQDRCRIAAGALPGRCWSCRSTAVVLQERCKSRRSASGTLLEPQCCRSQVRCGSCRIAAGAQQERCQSAAGALPGQRYRSATRVAAGAGALPENCQSPGKGEDRCGIIRRS